MMRQFTNKTLLLGALTSVLFTGCGFSSKPIGITNTFNYDYFETMNTLGHKCYGNYLHFIGEYPENDNNIGIINQSISELYEEFNISNVTTKTIHGIDCETKYANVMNEKIRDGLVSKCLFYKDNRDRQIVVGTKTGMTNSNNNLFPKTFIFSNPGIGFHYKFDFITEDNKIFIIATIKIDRNNGRYDSTSLEMKNRFYELLEKNGLKTDFDKKSNISDKQLEKLFCHI